MPDLKRHRNKTPATHANNDTFLSAEIIFMPANADLTVKCTFTLLVNQTQHAAFKNTIYLPLTTVKT